MVEQSRSYKVSKNWPDPNISEEEMKVFLGMLIVFGYNKLSSKAMFWSERQDLRTKQCTKPCAGTDSILLWNLCIFIPTLISIKISIATGKKPSIRPNESRSRIDGKNHLVQRVPGNRKRRCAGNLCSSIMQTQCKKCDVWLCIDCFATYHTTYKVNQHRIYRGKHRAPHRGKCGNTRDPKKWNEDEKVFHWLVHKVPEN